MRGRLPAVVQRIGDAVGERLGRPAHCRQVKNRENWFIYDPVISFIQQGMKRGNTGYRVGYAYDAIGGSVWFILVHSPIIAKLFKRNLILASMLHVIRSTADYRSQHLLYRSSKQAARSGGGKDGQRIASRSIEEFLDQLETFDARFGFVADLFPTRPNTGKGGGKAPVAGNTFYLKLADKRGMLRSKASISRLVELTWPLFLCMYPVKPIETRTAGLARKMRAGAIPRICEFASIRFPRESAISPLCRGEIQGAHIKPDALGGSDRPENGIWLCEYHHRTTEGKLKGRRNEGILDVRFVAKS